ncbi:MAG: MBL fold metallo-hydrolase [Undibacterium sp.]|nr:MBL fold metallo-hydrolase [Opitutaceae bacterium]
MAWVIHQKHGIHLPQIGWSLDATRRAERAFVSHAHSDHMARHAEVVCTRATARLMRARLPAKNRAEHILPFGHTEQLTPDCTVTLHPAGHIYGSAQILLDHAEHGTLLYTGDFKLHPGHAAELCATPRADTLVMETTFGLPRYVFPPAAKIIANLITFCRDTLAAGATPVLLCYSLGKSQEVLRALAGSGLPIMLQSETHRLTRICAQLGLDFPVHPEFDPATHAGHVVICPPHAPGLLKRIPSPRTASITGWALDSRFFHGSQNSAAFPLSDHADFPSLLRFVELVQPQRVFTVHGFAKEFAATLCARGIEASPLGQAYQPELRLA